MVLFNVVYIVYNKYEDCIEDEIYQCVLMNFIFYVIFMFIIYSISYIEWDYRFFFMKINVENYLVGDGYGQFGFKGVYIF